MEVFPDWASHARATPSRREFDDLHRLVCSLQQALNVTKRKQDKQEGELQELQAKTDELDDKTEGLEAKTEELEDKLDAEAAEDADSSGADEDDLATSVDAIFERALEGRWVAMSGYLWRKGSKPGDLELVSQSEVGKVLGGPWASFSCHTDEELLELRVFRAGKDQSINTPVTQERIDDAEAKFLSRQ
jgi:hypothetical protein